MITVLNFVGGIAIGVLMNGMDINAPVQRYSILTIGDGLVSQIPSLMISLSTGIFGNERFQRSGCWQYFEKALFSTPKVLILLVLP